MSPSLAPLHESEIPEGVGAFRGSADRHLSPMQSASTPIKAAGRIRPVSLSG